MKAPKPADAGKRQQLHQFQRAFQSSENPPPTAKEPPLPSQVQCQPRARFFGGKILPEILRKIEATAQPKVRCLVMQFVANYQCFMDWARSIISINAPAKKPFRLPVLHSFVVVHIAGRFRCLPQPVAGVLHSFKDLTQRRCPRFTKIKMISRSKCHVSTNVRKRLSNIYLTHRQHEMTVLIEHHWFCCTKKQMPDFSSQVAWQAWPLGWGLMFSFL